MDGWMAAPPQKSPAAPPMPICIGLAAPKAFGRLCTPGSKSAPSSPAAGVTLRLDGHLIHVICGGVLAKTLPSPSQPPTAAGYAARASPRPRYRRPLPPVQHPAQGPPRRRHGHPPAAAPRRHLRREDRHRPRRGHPLPRHLRRRRDLPAPPNRTAPRQTMEGQGPRPKAGSVSSISCDCQPCGGPKLSSKSRDHTPQPTTVVKLPAADHGHSR
jgi:hypothetical protein